MSEFVINGQLELPQTAPSSEQFLAIEPDGTVVASGATLGSLQTSGAFSSGTFSPNWSWLTGTINPFGTNYLNYPVPNTTTSTSSTGSIILTSGATALNLPVGFPNEPEGPFLQIGNYVQFSFQVPVVTAFPDGLFVLGGQFNLPYFPLGSTVASYTITYQLAGSVALTGTNAIESTVGGGSYVFDRQIASGPTTPITPTAYMLTNTSPSVIIPSIVISVSHTTSSTYVGSVLTVFGSYVLS